MIDTLQYLHDQGISLNDMRNTIIVVTSTKPAWATVIQSEKEHTSFIVHVLLQLIYITVCF